MSLIVAGCVMVVVGAVLIGIADPPMPASADRAVTAFGGLLVLGGVMFVGLAYAIAKGWVS